MGFGERFTSLFRRKSTRRSGGNVQSGPSFSEHIVVAKPADPSRAAQAFPRFQSSASDQLDRRSADRFAGLRIKLRSAFTPSQPVADRRMFAGRLEALTTMIRSLEDQRLHVVIYGERGIGKTSLLHMLARTANDAKYIVVYTSCGATSNFDEIFRAASADIPLLYHDDYGPTAAETEKGSSVADLLPAAPLTARQFGNICSKLSGTRVLLILDEFDRCESVNFRRDVAELIKNLSDRSIRVQLVIAGVAADLTDLVEHIPSIRRNIFAQRIEPMTDAEVRELVQNGGRLSEIEFRPDAAQMIVDVAQGSPYVASLLCHHAGLNALRSSRGDVHIDDVMAAVDKALDELRGRVSRTAQHLVDTLLNSGMGEMLASMAGASLKTGGQFSCEDMEAAGSLSRQTCVERAEALVREGVLLAAHRDELGPAYRFVDDGMPLYLWIMVAQRRTASGLRVGAEG